MKAQDIYTESVRLMPAEERVHLISLILGDLTRAETPPALVDENDGWTTQDQLDGAAYSMDHAATLYPEDEELV